MAIDTSKPKEKRGAIWVWAQVLLLLVYILIPRMGYWIGLPLLFSGLGVLFMGWGIMILIVAVRTIGWKNISPFPRPPKNASLVTEGPFHYIRHPMYMAVILFTLGWPLSSAHWARFVVAGGIAAFLLLKARNEENYLRERFPGYAEYASRTKGFLPGLY